MTTAITVIGFVFFTLSVFYAGRACQGYAYMRNTPEMQFRHANIAFLFFVVAVIVALTPVAWTR
jgi:hypothetical protein